MTSCAMSWSPPSVSGHRYCEFGHRSGRRLRLPRGIPFGASRIEITRHAEVEGCAKDSVGKRDRGQLARPKRGVGSVRLKFVQQVPHAVQGVSDNQGEGQTRAQQGYRDKRHDGSGFHLPRLPCRSEVGRESQVERGNHDKEHRVEDLLRLGPKDFPGNEDSTRRGHEPDHRVEDHDYDKSKHAVSLAHRSTSLSWSRVISQKLSLRAPALLVFPRAGALPARLRRTERVRAKPDLPAGFRFSYLLLPEHMGQQSRPDFRSS